ncbi:phosphoglucomutase/phosphomannomutase family protein [Deinococcus sp. 14RED07]|uniref:phosphoglucomutase/phosphomannomutase family protein n=1 Tax=Deinococcus sp. 14RED07 TaxID=2745874 RepID=UPI001E3DE78C|nr:phosphoglucomutase/phosphomannomutase family protein [Deinococcus sp. 14RED07]MCD0176671.1 phosphoglucomutase/phosphomannomutase family protein [Deinococcus sp. 14RED07]
MKLSFGTDGWRGVIADEFTFANVGRVARAHAQALLDAGGRSAVVAHDTRFLGGAFARSAGETLQAAGLNVTVLQGATPTPALSYAVRAGGHAGGVMITASHNPGQYQGYKLKGSYGGSATPALVAEVEARLDGPATPHAAGQFNEADVRAEYLGALARLVDTESIRRAGLPVYHDAMHGAAGGWIEEFTREYLGVPFHGLRATPDPLFGGVNPEPITQNLQATMQAMRDVSGPAFAMVTDGDADRIGAVLSGGRFFNSHQIFAVLLHHLASQGKRGIVVRTVSTSGIIERLAQHHGLRIVQTPVGFKYITEAFLHGEAHPEDAVLIGGEESGGIGVQGHVPERDGLLNGLLLQEAVAATGLGLDEQFAQIEALVDFRHHYDRVDLHLPRPIDRVALMDDVAGLGSLGGHAVQDVVTMDGVKLVFGGGYGMVRASGTEPVVRLYVEAPSDAEVQGILTELRERTLRHLPG